MREGNEKLYQYLDILDRQNTGKKIIIMMMINSIDVSFLLDIPVQCRTLD